MSIRKFILLKQSWDIQVVKDDGLEPWTENWFGDLSVFIEVKSCSWKMMCEFFKKINESIGYLFIVTSIIMYYSSPFTNISTIMWGDPCQFWTLKIF